MRVLCLQISYNQEEQKRYHLVRSMAIDTTTSRMLHHDSTALTRASQTGLGWTSAGLPHVHHKLGHPTQPSALVPIKSGFCSFCAQVD